MHLSAVLAADPVVKASSNGRLALAAVVGIAVVVVLITIGKVHPFLSLILGAGALGVAAGYAVDDTVASFTTGVGSTVGSVGLLVALGAMIGGLLADSGGADRLVGSVVGRVSGRALPWAMAALAALIGLPLFFEIGVVLLVPVVLLVSTRTDVPLMKIGIPALAGLSVLHGLVPPHPGPLAAIATLKADLGLTLAFGLIIAVPTVVVAGPLLGSLLARYVHAEAPAALLPTRQLATVGGGAGGAGAPLGEREARDDLGGVQHRDVQDRDVQDRGVPAGRARRQPAFWPVVLTILLPIVLMLARAVGELTLDEDTGLRSTLDTIGTPVIALLAGVVLAMFTLGRGAGLDRDAISASLGGSLPAIAGILLIVAAGGGFKQVLIDAGVGEVIADAAKDASLSPLLLGWLVAVGIRVATGSATVATITAAGIVTPLAADLSRPDVALLALAVGCGSLFFSHVNDAGFWLVKEYFGLSVGQTLATWSVMETVISVVGFAGVLLLHLVT